MAMLSKTDWSWIAEMRCEKPEAEVELVSEELITPEIRTEIAADITQICRASNR